MELTHGKSRLFTTRILLLALSVISLVICVVGATAHYRKASWGDPWQPIGWLLSMFFLLAAFTASPRELAGRFKSLANPRAAFFLFWILFFVVSHLWNFRTAPWNGDALFDESGWDLWYLKSYVIGHPYQAAWFHPPISRETLFHYYVWGFLRLFGFNILSYEAAVFVIWLTTFIFTLLLVDLFFRSYIVTSVTALVFNFLPFAFIYTFAGYRYPMAVAFAVVSLYFLHVGFRNGSPFCLSMGGIAAGLCLASSISGKQYLLALAIAAPLYGLCYWRQLKAKRHMDLAGFRWLWLSSGCRPHPPVYSIQPRKTTPTTSPAFVRDFWHAMQSAPFPIGIRPYIDQLRSCFFSIPALRFFIPDTLPIPLPYYWLLVPGVILAVWEKRFEIVLLATIPVVGAFVAGAIENRLLLPIPFWMILMSFTVAWVLKLRPWPGVLVIVGAVAALILLDGLVPSIRYIYSKTTSPFSIHYYAQQEVAVSRFLRHVVAGQEHPRPPQLEHNEFNRIERIPDAPYDTFVCQDDAYSIIHLFLRDYDDAKIMSFCGGYPFFFVMTEQDVWNANKKAVSTYVPTNKNLKLIWERDPKTERIIKMFQSLRELGTEDSLSFSFGGRVRTFYVLNIPSENIPQFQQAVSTFPETPLQVPGTQPSRLSPLPERVTDMSKGGKGTGRGQFDSPTGIAVDGKRKCSGCGYQQRPDREVLGYGYVSQDFGN